MGSSLAYLQITGNSRLSTRVDVVRFVEAMREIFDPTIFYNDAWSFFVRWDDHFKPLIKENNLWEDFDEEDVILHLAKINRFYEHLIKENNLWEDFDEEDVILHLAKINRFYEHPEKEIDYIYSVLGIHDDKIANAVHKMALGEKLKHKGNEYYFDPIVLKIDCATGILSKYYLHEATPESLVGDWLACIKCRD